MVACARHSFRSSPPFHASNFCCACSLLPVPHINPVHFRPPWSRDLLSSPFSRLQQKELRLNRLPAHISMPVECVSDDVTCRLSMTHRPLCLLLRFRMRDVTKAGCRMVTTLLGQSSGMLRTRAEDPPAA